MKLLIIGGTGTISSAVVKRALEKGIDITVLNRGHHELPKGVHQITADMRDEKAAAAALGNSTFDVVADFITFTKEQAAQGIRLFQGRCKQYLFISSATVYQKPPKTLFVSEGTPLNNPFSEYAQNKIICENEFMQGYRDNGFPITIVRPSYTYGDEHLPFIFNSHKSRYALISRLKRGKPIIIPGDGSIFWTITHAGDFAHAFVGLMGRMEAVGHAFHITTDECHTWDDFAHIIADALGVKARLEHISTDTLCRFIPEEYAAQTGDKAQTAVFDNSKIKSFVPDFVCKTPFVEGISGCIRYYEENPDKCVEDPEWDALVDEIIEKSRSVKP